MLRPSLWNAFSLLPVCDPSWSLPGDKLPAKQACPAHFADGESEVFLGTLHLIKASPERCVTSRGQTRASATLALGPAAAWGAGVRGSVTFLKDTCGTPGGETLNKLQEEKIRSPHFPRTQRLPRFGDVLILNLSPPWTWPLIKEGVLFFLKVLGQIRSAEFQVL